MAAENVVVTQATIGMIGAAVLAWLKKAAWIPWINQHSAVVNHSILLLTSACGALGVHWVWNASGHSLTITGLDFAAMAAGLWIWTKQWTVQFLVQRGIFGNIASPAPTPILGTSNVSPLGVGVGILTGLEKPTQKP